MIRLWSGRSIAARLTRMNLLVSGTALILACIAFLAYDLISFRQDLIRSLSTEAQIIGSNSISALLFDDPQSAQTTLSALQNAPQVLSAVIVASNGRSLAAYAREGEKPVADLPVLPTGSGAAQWSRGSNILLGSRINFQGQSVGTVYMLARTSEIGHRARQYGLIAAVILLLCLATALLVSSNSRRWLAEPIVSLAETARVVSREKNYSVRAHFAREGEELSVLVQSFNEMLEQIQERDRALQTSTEILEQRVAERTAELTAANRELEAFSYSVAHDLRGPLDVIGGIGYLLQNSQDLALDAESREMLDAIPRATRRMANLIDDLLNLSRATSTPLRREPIDLSELANSIKRELQAGDPARKAEIVITPGASVIADEGLMLLVMQNLIGNAWKYTSKLTSASIEFGFKKLSGSTVYFVHDNGAGFDPRFAERLFQPFQRLHMQNEFPGTGVGLATVQRIISRHGGKIWAEGEVDRGATFFFTV